MLGDGSPAAGQRSVSVLLAGDATIGDSFLPTHRGPSSQQVHVRNSSRQHKACSRSRGVAASLKVVRRFTAQRAGVVGVEARMVESGGGVLGEGAASSPPARGPEGALYALLVGSEAEPQPPNGFTTFQVLRIASPGTSVSGDLQLVHTARNADRCNSQSDTVCLFVCLPVRTSRSDIVSKRVKIRSCGFQRLVGQYL